MRRKQKNRKTNVIQKAKEIQIITAINLVTRQHNDIGNERHHSHSVADWAAVLLFWKRQNNIIIILSFESELKKKKKLFYERQKIIFFVFGDTLAPSCVSHYHLSHYGWERLQFSCREVMKRKCVLKTTVVKAKPKCAAHHKGEQPWNIIFFLKKQTNN